MDILTSLLVVGFAALIHASFQLSASVLTMLSGHSLGAKRSHAKLMQLTLSFILGTKLMTLFLLSFIAIVLMDVFVGNIPQIVWACACGLLVGLGIAVWLFYYKRDKGTSLWIPRPLASYLNERSKATKTGAEAFGLGMTGVISELLFIFGPMVISALILISLPALWQLAGLVIYTVISSLSSVLVWGIIGGGHSLSRIQKWRETNKLFLQFAGGGGLLIVGFFVYVSEVMLSSAGSL